MIDMLIITNDGYVSYDVYVSYHINEVIAMMAIIEMMAMITYNIYANSESLEVLLAHKTKSRNQDCQIWNHIKQFIRLKMVRICYAIAVKIFKDYSSNA